MLVLRRQITEQTVSMSNRVQLVCRLLVKGWFKTPSADTLFDLLPTELCSTLLEPFNRLMERTTGAR